MQKWLYRLGRTHYPHDIQRQEKNRTPKKTSSSAKVWKSVGLRLREAKASTTPNSASAPMPGTRSWRKSDLFILGSCCIGGGTKEFTLSLFPAFVSLSPLFPFNPQFITLSRPCSPPSALVPFVLCPFISVLLSLFSHRQ